MQRFTNFRQRLFQNRLAQNALALFVVQFARYLLPLATVPYLSRVLGPDIWGYVLIAQSFSMWLFVVVEYGFNLSATRDVARHRNQPEQLAKISASVLGARLFLFLVSLLITLGVYLILKEQSYANYLWLGWLLAVTAGFMPYWYFQGIEQMRSVATLDVLTRVISTTAIFIVVKNPNDAWKVLFLQVTANVLSLLISFFWLYGSVAFAKPQISNVKEGLQTGWKLFLASGIGSLYTTANGFILGLMSTPSNVSFYASSERLSKAALSLLQPVTQVLFPRLSYLLSEKDPKAVRTIRFSLAFMMVVSSLFTLSIILFAPVIVKLLLGAQFISAIPVLRIVSLLIPLIAFGQVLGVQWLIALGWDSVYIFLGIFATLISIGLAFILVPHYGAVGMAWAVVAAEFFVSVSLFVFLAIKGQNPIIGLRSSNVG